MADLKLKDLRYLVALADTRHFGQAATRCFVSQPTLSAQIKKLEHYLGVELVERQPKRRIALTDMGEKVVERARRLLAEADGIQALTRKEGDPLSGKLKVGLIPTIGPYLLPLVARKLHKQLPKLQLMLYEYQTAVLLDKLHRRDRRRHPGAAGRHGRTGIAEAL
jgi:LysR family hydrogen peroxide-inducible transcriptional activator